MISVGAVGIRQGDVLIGASNDKNSDVKGTIMQIFSDEYPENQVNKTIMKPIAGSVKNDSVFVRDKLNNLAFFKDLTVPQREEYLAESSPVSRQFDQIGLLGRFISLSGAKFDQLDQETKGKLLSRNLDRDDGLWPLGEVAKMTPTPTGSPSMIFRNNLWSHYIDDELARDATGSMVTISGDIVNINEPTAAYVYGIVKVMIPDDSLRGVKPNNLRELCDSMGIKAKDGEIDLVDLVEDLTTTHLKSLMQKIIRYGSNTITVPSFEVAGKDIEVNSERLLKVVFLATIMSPGSFNPNIGKYTSGLVAATKRLAVSIFEDSYIDNIAIPLSLLASSYIAGKDKSWFPGLVTIGNWLVHMQNIILTDRHFAYTNPNVFKNLNDSLEDTRYPELWYCASLLEYIKSFTTDISMLNDIANNRGKSNETKNCYTADTIAPMRVSRFIDNHCCTDVIYFMKHVELGGPDLVKLIWDKVGSINRRKISSKNKNYHYLAVVKESHDEYDLSGDYPAQFPERVADIMSAQKRYWIWLNRDKFDYGPEYVENPEVYNKDKADMLKPLTSLYNIGMINGADLALYQYLSDNLFEYTFSDMWISYLVGMVLAKVDKYDSHTNEKIGGQLTVQVFLDPDDTSQVKAIIKPTRGVKQTSLLPVQYKQAKDQFHKKIRNQIVVKKISDHLGMSVSGNVTIKMEDSRYTLNGQDWNVIKHGKLHTKVREYSYDREKYGEYEMLPTIRVDEPIVDSVCTTVMLRQFNSYEEDIKILILSLMSRATNKIKLPQIGRGGESRGIMYSHHYQLVNDYLMTMCISMPGIIRLDSPGVFEIINYVGFHCFVKRTVMSQDIANREIKNNIYRSNSANFKQQKKDIPINRQGWKDNRVEYEYREPRPWQQDATDHIMRNYNNFNNIGFISAGTGTGKTMASMMILDELIKSDRCPKYCLWLCPASAVEQVKNQFKLSGFKYEQTYYHCIVNGSTKQPIKPYRVTIITHDEVKNQQNRHYNVEEILTKYVRDSFVVLDEIHLSFNSSKRGSAMYNYALQSKFFLGISGTFFSVGDMNMYLKWLQLAVPFEIDRDNYFIALGSIVSVSIGNDVKIKRQKIVVEMTSPEKSKYYSVVPSLMGGTSKAIDIQLAKQYSLDAIERKMMEMVTEFKSKGEPVFLVLETINRARTFVNNLPGNFRTFIIHGNKTISYNLEDSIDQEYDLIIATSRKAEGYGLTRISKMITTTYFSNQATRKQLEGRLDRFGQTKEVTIYTVVSGLMRYIYDRYEHERNVMEIVKSLEKTYNQ
ncbi:MAG: DEAD/DEAH box helicase family protein [Bacteroidetes bacterium]|nr:DEAD/DEAH box helicase family protein [Bacteroidota bacterium]